jgi:hypothetical protein
MQNINIDNVRSVYSGKVGRCCCGCSGTHSYSSKYANEYSKKMGYEVTVNDRMITKVVNIIKNSTEVEHGENYLATTIGKRLYIIYMD